MKIQLLLFSLIITYTITNAQVKSYYGVRAGAISSGMKGDAVKSLDGILDFANGMITTADRTGYFAGAFAGIPLAGMVTMEPGIFYTQKGYQLNGALNVKGLQFLGVNAKAALSMQYIDIPVIMKANFGGLQLFAGPQLSYLVKSDLTTTAGALGFNLFNNTIDATGQFNRWDTGLTGGLGYQFSNGMNIMASYDQGLSRVDANKNMAAYNRSYKVGLGMKL